MNTHFSKLLNGLLAGLLILVLIAVGLPRSGAQAAPAVQSAVADCDPSRTVQVSGTAVVNVVPDRALVQLGVESTDLSIEGVKALNSRASQNIINAIRGLGVEAKDIATDRYIVTPVYQAYDSLTIKGYTINNVIAVTLRDVSKVSDLVSAALNAGANQVLNVQMYTSELRKYRDQAREMAMKAASEKAQALAGAVGAQAGCVLNIQENTYSSYYGGWWWGSYGRDRNLYAQNAVTNVAPEQSPTELSGDSPLSLGQVSVQAQVNVSFGLK